MPRKKAAPPKGAARREDAAQAAAPEQDTKHAGGRPTKYQPQFAEQAAKLCLAFGAIDRDLADFFGVTEKTIFNWRESHPEFLRAINAAKAQSDSVVERRLFERACGFSHPELYIAQHQGALITKEIVKQYPPDTAAAIFWLKNRQTARWRDKVDHEHGLSPDNPIVSVMERIASAGHGGKFQPKG